MLMYMTSLVLDLLWVARVKVCNSVNLKPVRIIELLLKIVTRTVQLHVDISRCC